MKTIKPRDVITWIKTFKGKKTFTWNNLGECGCLFTEYIRANGFPNAEVYLNGKVNRGELCEVPFHDAFWKKVDPEGIDDMHQGIKVSKTRAIKILKELEV